MSKEKLMLITDLDLWFDCEGYDHDAVIGSLIYEGLIDRKDVRYSRGQIFLAPHVHHMVCDSVRCSLQNGNDPAFEYSLRCSVPDAESN